MNLQELREKLKALHLKAQGVIKKADDEKRDLTEAEQKDIDDTMAEFGKVKADIDRRESLLKQGETINAVSGQNIRKDAPSGTITVSAPEWTKDPMKGYKSHREFFRDVMKAEQTGEVSQQLKFLSAAGSDEQQYASKPYGGYLVPDGMLPGIKSVGFEGDPTASLVTQVPMESPIVAVNARTDKNHTTSVSGGLTVARRAETAAITTSRMEMEQVKLEAVSLTGAAYATEEILARSPISFAALIEAGFRDEFSSKMLSEKISGTSVGQPEGVLNCPATLTGTRAVNSEISGADITGLRKRVWRYSSAIWLANHDTYDQLAAAHLEGTNSDVFLFNPARGEDVPDMLLGRPIFFTEYAPGLGSKGDLGVYNWSEYLWGTLVGGPQMAESMHVRFLNHERTFKFWMENDGRCWWRSALTPKNGANQLSPFVVLAANT